MKIIYVIVTYILGFFGLFSLIFGGIELSQYYEAKTWSARTGVITESKAVESLSASKRTWRYIIKGNYEPSGQPFTIRKISYDEIGEGVFDHRKAYSKKNASKYYVGKKVFVYAAADNPEFTILEPNPHQGSLHMVIAVGGLFVLNFILYTLFFRPKKND